MANTKSIDLESGSSQYLSIADGSQTGLDITGDMTIEGWVKLESAPASGDERAIVSKYTDASRSFIFVYRNVGGVFRFELIISQNGSANNDADTRIWTYELTAGTWYHVAVVLDIGNTMELFVNGVSQGSNAVTPTAIYNSTAPFQIGANTALSWYMDGLMDEVIIWNDIRTSTEIGESYNSGDGKVYNGDEANMVAYWRFEDDLLDETTNNNDLTNNNSATYSTDVPFAGSTPATGGFMTLNSGYWGA